MNHSQTFELTGWNRGLGRLGSLFSVPFDAKIDEPARFLGICELKRGVAGRLDPT